MSAVVELEAAVASDPGSAPAHLRLGNALLARGRSREAEAELRAALALDPGCTGAWVNLGGILLARWELTACVEANRRASAIDPACAAAHFNEGLGHMYRGRPSEMAACFERVLELQPENGSAFCNLAIALNALGRVDEARLAAAYAGELGCSPDPALLADFERAAARATQKEASTEEEEAHGIPQGR